MAFRAGEEIKAGTERAIQYLTPRFGTTEQKELAKELVIDLIEKYGPVVRSYPIWHPMVTQIKHDRIDQTVPCSDSGFGGLDHSIMLANAVITCPYDDGRGVFDSVDRLNATASAAAQFIPSMVERFNATVLDTPLYHINATPILITCSWFGPDEDDNHLIPARAAIQRMLLKALPHSTFAEHPEEWEGMREELLGKPCGKVSSLFVSPETGHAMRSVWNSLIKAGMFG